jgi:1,4-dihydroxy-2-naphthoate octaprenyltransferase/uncharacterized membrane protein YphA (DoxX/SURF4 family)
MMHMAANLTNTYYDFKKGVDKDDADDRTLVDKTVSEEVVFYLAVGLFAASTAIIIFLAATVGLIVLLPAVPGILLAFFYTADPCNLKAMGLGDVAVFLNFGPLLMAGVSIAVLGFVEPQIMLFSVPVGLLTDAILHANNHRDVKADAAAGVKTLAQYLGEEKSYHFYIALLFGSYAICTLAAISYGWRLLIVWCNLPWTVYIIRRFRGGCTFAVGTADKKKNDDAATNHSVLLAELPQRTAQHNLMFCVLLGGALMPPMMFARGLIGCLFYLGGVNNILLWRYITKLVHQHLHNFVRPDTDMRVLNSSFETISTVALVFAVLMQLGCGVCFILGYAPRLCAQVLLAFLVPVTVLVHDFWTIEGDSDDSYGALHNLLCFIPNHRLSFF